MNQGYVTLALGDQRYYDMAVTLAMSVHVKDPKRPISLICDANGKNKVPEGLFQNLIELREREGYKGCANKLRLYNYSPYDETMFIDSDCVFMKQDMDRHWDIFSQYNFNIAGYKLFDGMYYQFDVKEVCKKFDCNFIAAGNSGVIYFKKSDQAKELFELAQKLFSENTILKVSHGKTVGQIADEPVFGTAMGILGIEPYEYKPEEGAVMIATWRGRKIRGDFDAGTTYLEKPLGGFHLLNRFFAKKGWVSHSPSMHHFIGLKPKKLYKEISEAVQRQYQDIAATK